MKRMIYVIGKLILMLLLVLDMSFVSNAYTEEEKQQAKAWLSAHGYSPDQAGAGQAYQDYLNGKFDEELGVDVNGDGIPPAGQTTDVSGDATSDALTKDKMNTETTEKGADTAANDSDNEVVGSAGEVSGQTIEASGEEYNLSSQNHESLLDGVAEMNKDAVDEENTLYQSARKDQYQEAATVIVLSVVLMLLLGLWLK